MRVLLSHVLHKINMELGGIETLIIQKLQYHNLQLHTLGLNCVSDFAKNMYQLFSASFLYV